MSRYYELLFLLSAVAIAVYFYLKHKFSYWKNRGVPYIEGTLPYGCLKGLKKAHVIHTIDYLYSKLKDKKPFGGAYFFLSPVAIVSDMDLIKNILIKDFNYFQDRAFYYNEKDDPISAHLFALDGEKWRPLRAKLSPTFTSGKMKYMYSKIVEVSERLHGTLNKNLETTNIVNIKDLLGRFTTDVIGCCAFGVECNSLNDPKAKFRVESSKVFDNPKDTEMSRLFKAIYPCVGNFFKCTAVDRNVSNFFSSVVMQTVHYREQNNVECNDFMQLLIQLKNQGKLKGEESTLGKISEEELISEAFLFFSAGFETSSTTMAYSLYELSLNQSVQDRARQEVMEVLSRHDGKFTYEAIMEMTYIDNIVTEALRKYPALTFLQRKATQDYKVPGYDVVIEKGTLIFIPVWSLQRDPEIYPDPEVFEPDRFSPEEAKNRHPMTFLGFGDGPRNCIGLRFGRLQSKLGLATLLRDYKFDMGPDTPRPIKFLQDGIVLAPVDGLTLKVEKI